MPTYVLGTHTSHNGSSCLLKDGKVEVAIEKERLTGVKHDGGNDNATVQYCLKAAGIGLREVELVVQNANFHMFETSSGRAGRIVDDAHRVVTISHHLAHMFSAIGTAPFSDMTVLVIDGCGNCYADCMDKEGAFVAEVPPSRDLEQLYFEKDSYYEYRSGRWRAVYKDFSPFGPRQGYPMHPVSTMHSIGGAYSGVSAYVFRGSDDPGKLMGLAPYGRSGVYTDEMFTLRDGRVFLNYEWMKKFRRPALDYQTFKADFQYYADIAYWAQRQIERALLYVVNHRYESCPAENLAYAGGVALNAVANRLIRTQTKFRNVYVQPAAGDNGLALGCAFYGWLELLEGRRHQHGGGTSFGRRTYFEQDYASPYMLMVAPTRQQWRDQLAAVVHRDGTARVQTVQEEITPRYYQLLQAIKQRCGTPVLLNTSFNKRGMPIVEKPQDAIALFLETALDALVLEDWLLLKKEAAAAPLRGTLDLAGLFQKICESIRNEAGPQIAGVLEIVVTGADQRCIVDLSGPPRVLRDNPPRADHVVVFTWEALQEAINKPAALAQLYESGRVRIPGASAQHPQIVVSLARKVTYLLEHAPKPLAG
jgi:predicted NodU family carbamoyl transferase